MLCMLVGIVKEIGDMKGLRELLSEICSSCTVAFDWPQITKS
jgi:hypothetical protein